MLEEIECRQLVIADDWGGSDGDRFGFLRLGPCRRRRQAGDIDFRLRFGFARFDAGAVFSWCSVAFLVVGIAIGRLPFAVTFLTQNVSGRGGSYLAGRND